VIDYRCFNLPTKEYTYQNKVSRRSSRSNSRSRRGKRSNSRSRLQSKRIRSSSRERRSRSRSLRRSTSKKRTDSRSRNHRDRSPESLDRLDPASQFLDLRQSDRPFREGISPTKKHEQARSKKNEMTSKVHSKEDGDLRDRIEMLKRDIKRHKMHLEEQRYDDEQDHAKDDYNELLESESAWQQMALEDENKTSGRLKYLEEQNRGSVQQLMYHESQLRSHRWSSHEQSRSPVRIHLGGKHDDIDNSPPHAHSRSPANYHSHSRSPNIHDSRLYYQQDCFISDYDLPVQEKSYQTLCSPPDQRFSLTKRNYSPTLLAGSDDTEHFSSEQVQDTSGNVRCEMGSRSPSPMELPEQPLSESNASIRERRFVLYFISSSF